jgi:uncharacterized protein YbaR (Trm112 family)
MVKEQKKLTLTEAEILDIIRQHLERENPGAEVKVGNIRSYVGTGNKVEVNMTVPEAETNEHDRLVCPHCGGHEVRWQEFVCHSREISQVSPQTGVLFTYGNSEMVDHEDNKEESLWCNSCGKTFPVPEDVYLEHS